MGEEEKKPADEVKIPVENKEDPPSAAVAGESKTAAEEPKDLPPPPPPPQEIVLTVFMHCEGCARKVRRCLKGFDGVENVVTDCKTHKVVVKGEKADPLKVLERVQKKSHRQVVLLSPIPPPPTPEAAAAAAEEPKKPPEEVAKPEEKKEEPQVITVVLKAHMHCEACAEAIKRRILRMKGVENVEPDFKGSLVTVSGVFDPPSLVEYVAKKTGKRVVVLKVEPKKEEAGPGEEKNAEEGNDEKKAEEGKNREGGEKEGGTETESKQDEGVEVPIDPKMELKKHELYYYYPIQSYHHQMNPQPQRFAQDGYGNNSYGYPQMFSDENPNACSVM